MEHLGIFEMILFRRIILLLNKIGNQTKTKHSFHIMITSILSLFKQIPHYSHSFESAADTRDITPAFLFNIANTELLKQASEAQLFITLISKIFSLTIAPVQIVDIINNDGHRNIINIIDQLNIDNIFESNPLSIIRLGKSIAIMLRHKNDGTVDADILSRYNEILDKITRTSTSNETSLINKHALSDNTQFAHTAHELCALLLQSYLLKAPRDSIDADHVIDLSTRFNVGYSYANATQGLAWLRCLDKQYDQASADLEAHKNAAIDLYLNEKSFNRFMTFENDRYIQSDLDVNTAIGCLFRTMAHTRIAKGIIDKPRHTLIINIISDVRNSLSFYKRANPPWLHGIGLWHMTAGATRYVESKIAYNRDRKLAESSLYFRKASSILNLVHDTAISKECDKIYRQIEDRTTENLDSIILKSLFDEIPGRGKMLKIVQPSPLQIP